MNILTGKLPQCITVCGSEYAINTDFRTWIEFEELMLEGSKANETFARAILLCMRTQDIVKTSLPPSLEETLKALSDFYFCRTAGTQETQRSAAAGGKRLYSFSKDASLIYAAFLQQYGIDLAASNMHWWKFRALFSALSGDLKICSVMKIRSAELSEISDSSARSRLARLKAMYALPDLRSESEKEAELAEALW